MLFASFCVGEFLEKGIENAIVLEADEALVLHAFEEFDDVMPDGVCVCMCVRGYTIHMLKLFMVGSFSHYGGKFSHDFGFLLCWYPCFFFPMQVPLFTGTLVIGGWCTVPRISFHGLRSEKFSVGMNETTVCFTYLMLRMAFKLFLSALEEFHNRNCDLLSGEPFL